MFQVLSRIWDFGQTLGRNGESRGLKFEVVAPYTMVHVVPDPNQKKNIFLRYLGQGPEKKKVKPYGKKD